MKMNILLGNSRFVKFFAPRCRQLVAGGSLTLKKRVVKANKTKNHLFLVAFLLKVWQCFFAGNL